MVWSTSLTDEIYFNSYEIHVTVRTRDVEAFKRVCSRISNQYIQVKPIVLDLQDREGNTVFQDVMTSSTFRNITDRDAHDAADKICAGLRKHGFSIARWKIETTPWHWLAPKRDEDPMPEGSYFETHLAVVAQADTEPRLRALARSYGLHPSRNTFKQLDDTQYILMLTHRAYSGSSGRFQDTARKLRELLLGQGFQVEKEIVEFAIYDSNVAHDEKWICPEDLEEIV